MPASNSRHNTPGRKGPGNQEGSHEFQIPAAFIYARCCNISDNGAGISEQKLEKLRDFLQKSLTVHPVEEKEKPQDCIVVAESEEEKVVGVGLSTAVVLLRQL